MMSIFKYKNATWTDLLEPTADEIKEVVDKYGIDPLVAHELSFPSMKHRVESRQHYIYLVLHFPIWKRSRDAKESQEIDFVIGPDFIITTRYEQIDAVDKFAKHIEVESILDKDLPGNGRDLIFFNLLGEIIRGVNNQLDYVEDALINIQRRMFDRREKDVVFSLSEASRHILDFRKITSPYHEALKTLEQVGEKMFGQDFGFSTRGVIEELSKGETVLRHQNEYLAELRETNNSLLSTKQNEFLILLAVIALVTDIVVGVILIYYATDAHL